MSRRALAALLACACAGGASPGLAQALPGGAEGSRSGDVRLRTGLRLTDGATGTPLLSCSLREGDVAVLTWRNSLFGLDVTETFVARGGGLELSSVSFADPAGGEPLRARPEDLDDLYHTGGPFKVEGLSRPVRQVVFRVGAIGNPTLSVAGPCMRPPTGEAPVSTHRLRFLDAVGFGGSVVLDVSSTALAGASPPEPKPGS